MAVTITNEFAMIGIVFRLLFLFFALTAVTFSQNQESILGVKIVSSVDQLKPGSSNRLAVELNIREPWHVNANDPRDAFLIPTVIKIDEIEGVTFEEIEYPLAEEKTFSFSDTPLLVYEGTVYAYVTVEVASGLAGKTVSISGLLTFQACNDEVCLPPQDRKFSRQFAVADAGVPVKNVNEAIFGVSDQGQEKSDLAQMIESKGLLVAFLSIFIAGLALNLTPCVYPLIPITFSYFGGQSAGKSANLFLLSIIYVLGMAFTYSILGVFAALTGSILGAWLQYPIVLLSIAVVMVALALSMFGLYEIRVPSFLSNFAGRSKRGYLGTLFMGLTVGIVAAPCIGPFVVALLIYVGESGDPFLGFWLFFVLALGLGIPYIFLGFFSGAMNRLPRSGAWMIWVKKIFGVILIGVAFYFVNPLFSSELWYYSLLAVTAILGGIYLAWIDPTEGRGPAFPLIKNLVGVLFVLAGVFFMVTSVEAYVDQRLQEISAGGQQTAGTATDAIHWESYAKEKLLAARAAQKPVMIDFFADWCIPCKELDKFTFTDPRVVEMAKHFVMLKADLTRTQSAEVQALQKQYQIRGVPTLVFLSPDGEEVSNARVLKFVNPEEFLPIMERVLQEGFKKSDLVERERM